jgi:hypothetical protein
MKVVALLRCDAAFSIVSGQPDEGGGGGGGQYPVSCRGEKGCGGMAFRLASYDERESE